MLSDLRLALRQMGKSPGQALAIILVLALGIGANTALFSVVFGVILRPLPYPQPERIVNFGETNLPQFPRFSLSPPNYLDFAKAKSFESVAAVQNQSFNLLGREEPVRIAGAKVSPDFFRVYGTQPLLGRWLLPEEDAEGKDNTVVLTYGIWQRVFGGVADIVGQRVNLSGQVMTVVGVMPQEWRRDTRPEIYVPMAFSKADLEDNRGAHYIGATARLKPGVTTEQATAELATIAAALAQQYPGSNKGWSAKAFSLIDDTVGDVRRILFTLLGAVGCVLLIACANIANLLLARATGRTREFAVRAAVGADRARLVRQLLTESLALSVLGGALGLLLAHWGLKALLAIAPAGLPRVSEIGLNGGVLAFNAGIAVLTGLAFGLIPAWQSSRVNLVEALKDGARGTSSSRHLVRQGLVVGEVALCFILLIGAGLLIRSFDKLQALDIGFDPTDATLVAINMAGVQRAQDGQGPVNFVNQVTEKIRGLPGVKYVGVTHTVPQIGDWVLTFEIDGRPKPAEGEEPNCNYYSVTPDYFPAMKVRLLRGRVFNEQDTAKTTMVGLISEKFAKQYFPNEDPIGKRVSVSNGPTKMREIVGVVADVKQYGVDQQGLPQFYDSFYQKPFNSPNFVIRTDGPALAPMLQALRPAVFAVDKDQPVSSIRPLAAVIADGISRQRFTATLLGLFAAIALLIAAVGIYGVMSYTVSQRTNELGVRLALGAQPLGVLGLVLRQGMGIVGLGLLLGAAGALALGRVVESLLFQTSVRDPLVFAGIAAAFALIALLACWLPARRAAKVDPMVALRSE